MLRRNSLITTAALVAVCAVPGTAAATFDVDVPPAQSPAAQSGNGYQDLRMPDTRDAARASEQSGGQDLRSPDATDAAAHRGLYEVNGDAYVLNRDYGSPDAVDAARDLPPVHIPAPVVDVREVPSGGFDWGDAGIGAAGMLGLFSIAAGAALLLTSRRRTEGFRVAH